MTQFTLTRRAALKSGLAVTGLAALPRLLHADEPATVRKNRIHQSACRWCYKDIPLDQLCAFAATTGMAGIDLLSADEWEIPRRYGLRCTMGYAGGGTIPDALNRTENHAAIEAAFRTNIPIAAKMGVPNVITFSGNRRGMPEDDGADPRRASKRALRVPSVDTDESVFERRHRPFAVRSDQVDHLEYFGFRRATVFAAERVRW